ncbi:MAG: type 1 glutamine amidotransferase [Armatimonadetes bacterium]|nr:type 1 glutamine amidotransferase [Armatimonadota bacterium]
MLYVIAQTAGAHLKGIRWHLERRAVPYAILPAWEITRYPDLARGDAIIGMGGPPSVARLDDAHYEHPYLVCEAGFIAHTLLEPVPFLGICMAHQLRAKLSHNPVQEVSLEHGLTEIVLNAEGRAHWLFAGVPERFVVFEHHNDQVVRLDRDGVLLASSQHCRVQAVAWGEVSASVQFHPEVLVEEMPEALSLEGARDSSGIALPADYLAYASRIFDNFLNRAGF